MKEGKKMKKTMKKIISIAAAAAMAVSVTAISACAILGDLNDSGKMNSADARMLLRYSAKLESIDEEHLKLADYSCDGKVNSADARLLLRAAAKVDDLEYYKNFYYKAKDGNLTIAMGYYNGDLYAEFPGESINMAALLTTNGDFTLIDHDKQIYGILKASEWENFVSALKGFAALQGETSADFSEFENINFGDMVKELTGSMGETVIPKPMKLLEEGYEKGTATWQGEEVTTYNNDKQTFFYKGQTLVGLSSEQGTISYENFTGEPKEIMYSYLNYQQEDFLVLAMAMANTEGGSNFSIPGLF